jgi:hypothetical protein
MDVLTYAKIAIDWNLWMEYVDTGDTMTEDEFNSMSTQEKITAMVDMFGTEYFQVTCGACSAETTVDNLDGTVEVDDWTSLECPECHVYGNDWEARN